MKTKTTLISAAVALTVLLASTGAAFAQGPADDTPGWGMGVAIDASLDEYMIPAIADVLGMSEADVAAEYDAGATFTSLALAQGVPADQVFDLFDSVRTQAIDLAVADGSLTAEEAAWLQSVQQGGNARGAAAGMRGTGLSTCDGTCLYDGVPQYLNQRTDFATSGMGSMGAMGRGGRR
ncbi:MAG: hypothetical protein PWQ55_911 [Chloroflexota bacterium]|nr:hypothetical protein [Chloroflexota bacterium]